MTYRPTICKRCGYQNGLPWVVCIMCGTAIWERHEAR